MNNTAHMHACMHMLTISVHVLLTAFQVICKSDTLGINNM